MTDNYSTFMLVVTMLYKSLYFDFLTFMETLSA